MALTKHVLKKMKYFVERKNRKNILKGTILQRKDTLKQMISSFGHFVIWSLHDKKTSPQATYKQARYQYEINGVRIVVLSTPIAAD